MEDKENLNSDDLMGSSMFASSGAEEGVADSMFASGEAESVDNDLSANSMFSEENNSKEDTLPTSMFSEAENTAKPVEEQIEQTPIEKEEQPKIAEKEPIQIIDDSEDDSDTEENPSDVVTVRPVKFKKFEATPPIRTIKKNLDIMQDISMHISVELGRTKLSIKEVMDFEQGSIVELNKIAGEQVEVFVNGKLVAKGEVIVIEDRFGVRITSTNIAKNPIIP